MSKHTPEPWNSYASTDLIVTKDDGIIADLRGNPAATMDKMRIVACVNACQGLADPAAEIAALRKEVAKYKAMHTEQNDTSNKLADRIIENHETIFRLRDMVAAAVVARDRLRQCPNTSTGAGGQTIDECVARRRYFNVPLAIFDEFVGMLNAAPDSLTDEIVKAAEKLTTPGATS